MIILLLMKHNMMIDFVKTCRIHLKNQIKRIEKLLKNISRSLIRKQQISIMYRTLHRLDKPIRKIQYLNSRNIHIHIRKAARLIRWNLIVPELIDHTLRTMDTLTKIHRTRNGPIRSVWKHGRTIVSHRHPSQKPLLIMKEKK